jgi:hypothetical protein
LLFAIAFHFLSFPSIFVFVGQTQQQESHGIKRRVIAIRLEGKTVNLIAPDEAQMKFFPMHSHFSSGSIRKTEYFTGLIPGS